MQVAVIKSKRDLNEGHWIKVIDGLEKEGISVSFKSVPADVYLVLGGRFENPLALNGKRILFFHKAEWKPNLNHYGWDYWFGRLMKEYYHDFYDCTNADLKGVIDQIKRSYDEHAEKRQVN